MSDIYADCSVCGDPAEVNEEFCANHLTPSPLDALARERTILLARVERLEALCNRFIATMCDRDCRVGHSVACKERREALADKD